jgi:hypothetical protein
MNKIDAKPQLTWTEATLPRQRALNRSATHSTFERLLKEYFARLVVSELPAPSDENHRCESHE